ncbi:MAG: RNA polymerase sporulation sigma factor SigH [Clostridiaceae bacterium]|nr:RNA polymerase sporulation sigma factor SigH [Clostridiaceae bacterium]
MPKQVPFREIYGVSTKIDIRGRKEQKTAAKYKIPSKISHRLLVVYHKNLIYANIFLDKYSQNTYNRYACCKRLLKGGYKLHNNRYGSVSNGYCKSLPDEKLVVLATTDNTYALDELISRYKNLVRAKARKYYLAGADNDDVIQEGMIGLFKAIKDFNKSQQSVFSSFASLCITRQILTAIKTAARNKHLPLNTFVSLNQPLDEKGSKRMLAEAISENPDDNPEAILLIKEQMSSITKKITNELSLFEKSVLSLYLTGYSYNDISIKLNRRIKSVDNALQRIKRKLGKPNDT